MLCIYKVGAAAAVVTMLVLALRMYSAFQQKLCCKEKWDHAVHWFFFLLSACTAPSSRGAATMKNWTTQYTGRILKRRVYSTFFLKN